uniref:uL15 LAA n=1 Tax=Spraguea lophii (strain 42_110) TaxID=1358809 RepID=UPI0022656F88|nr:Chain LAA, uL15 LAA [Spraguea lophii 42_110]7QJH_KAA Chain KAA, uL15 [Spraguea lophii 42_110]7QJH_LAA Chain LAA, uL15 [Spraguea lophii 42_110]8BR3_LAA Chain LAA, uL15 [Spraguea lophii 42_110]8P5D_LAA Chain LAA, uL15 [Spraguea lophii 42_110]8P60_KAA Chain KAA, Ribosomal protein L18e/L15P [Spraguea lophii 42_110]8P60_LAA Chain LAA, Ribosomal protein L18e/L15P [Spraguea lophii 42_110]
MFNKKSKSRKLRGHVSHGYGRVGKHRKHPAGRGKSGGLKHLRSLFQRYHPDHFRKLGIVMFHRNKNADFTRTVNVSNLWGLMKLEEQMKFKSSAEVPVVDCRNYGYLKVLGGGDLSVKKPIVVIARQFTKDAEEKINAVGGKCVVAA